MTESSKSSGEKHIEGIMRELDPASERYQVLDTARRFKSSWVELGECLLTVSRRNLFRDWGYESFEDYCSREIRIKKPTAQKLTLAYRFMEKDEPDLLARRTELRPLPDYRSVDLLRQAREEKDFSEKEYAELRQAVVEEGRSHPTVLKRFKEVAAAYSEPEENARRHLNAALGAARRLQTALNSLPELPQEHGAALGDLIQYLEEQAGDG